MTVWTILLICLGVATFAIGWWDGKKRWKGQ